MAAAKSLKSPFCSSLGSSSAGASSTGPDRTLVRKPVVVPSGRSRQGQGLAGRQNWPSRSVQPLAGFSPSVGKSDVVLSDMTQLDKYLESPVSCDEALGTLASRQAVSRRGHAAGDLDRLDSRDRALLGEPGRDLSEPPTIRAGLVAPGETAQPDREPTENHSRE